MPTVVSKLSGINFAELSADPEKAAALGWQLVREFFPVPPSMNESDMALRVRLDMLAIIAHEIGAPRFINAVTQAISLSRGRYDVTVLKIRECAGMTATIPPSAATRAWMFVMDVVAHHVRPAPEGGWQLEAWTGRVDGEIRTVSVPEIPEPVKRAVRAIGGWAALAETDPAFISQRMRDFKECYSEDSPCRDLVASERAK